MSRLARFSMHLLNQPAKLLQGAGYILAIGRLASGRTVGRWLQKARTVCAV